MARSSGRLLTANRGPWITDFVCVEDPVAGGVAQRIEDPAAAMNVPPSLRVRPLDILAQEQKGSPFLVVQCGGILGTRDMRLVPVSEFEFRSLSTIGAT